MSDIIRQHFAKEGKLTLDDALAIILKARNLLAQEPNLLELRSPITGMHLANTYCANHSTVVGDIHGQYYDLLKLFDITGLPPNTHYLFLGDYVDRGVYVCIAWLHILTCEQSCEVVLLLFALKINHPEKIHMLRGNHECRYLAENFNFKRECTFLY